MSHGIPESDWKVFRELREIALERFCERILGDAKSLTSDRSTTAHERFLKLYAQVNEQNYEIARAFDGPKRSSMLGQLAAMCSHRLLKPDELSRFSAETRETAESLGKRR